MIPGTLCITNRRTALLPLAALLAVLLFDVQLRADEPYARSRDYDLQHSKIALRFDLDQKKLFGDVTHSLAILRDGTLKIVFDSVGLIIKSVTLNKVSANFETTADKLIIPLPAAAKAGEKFDVAIRYEGKPSKGIYFILPDKDYPDRPKQIWTQGESEDTRYYLPTYDYPNDRLTTEAVLTVPASWITVSNGKLISVTDSGKGLKTWTWKESLPSSTYLITVVAGEFDEVKESWHGIPVSYYAPKGRGDRLPINYDRTTDMIELFSKKFGVDYPWEKYAQSMVDDFVVGGMENSSATTNNSSSLVHPRLAHEYITGEDDLISHELAHQWFGDLVTCKDWGNIWLNEGFATYGEILWKETHYGRDQADYERWSGDREWFQMVNLYSKPIVRRDFVDTDEFDENTYNKGGRVLEMLRHQLGEADFNRAIKHYLEVNRGKNVVTADLSKAIEEATHINVDQFFSQWVYGAGAPKFDLNYTYDNEKRQVALKVKQTQKIEGRVGYFRVPVEVEITNATGPKLYSITVWKANQVYLFPSESAPLMVLFDKGDHLLKSVIFHKEKKEWLYQVKNATDVADRADAVVALGKIKTDEEVFSALSDTLRNDKAWGVRATAADTLGQIGSVPVSMVLLDALNSAKEPWARYRIVTALGNFEENEAVIAKLESIAKQDNSYRARAAALQDLGHLKSPHAYAVLEAAVAGDSPDGFLRDAALRSFGYLGEDKAVPLLLQWAAVGKAIESRAAAISSLGHLHKDNKEITDQIAAYLTETHSAIRNAAIYALGNRGDASAIPALEALLKSDDLSIEMAPIIKGQIAHLKKPVAAKHNPHGGGSEEDGEEGNPAPEKPGAAEDSEAVAQRLDRLERLLHEVAERLKVIENRLAPPKP